MCAKLNNDELGLILENKAEKLQRGDLTRSELRDELAEILADMDGVLSKRGPTQAQGRVSFGRGNEGVDGLGLFIKNDGD